MEEENSNEGLRLTHELNGPLFRNDFLEAISRDM
jgi:hypothetical protein